MAKAQFWAMRQPDRSNPKQPAPPGYRQKPRNTPKSEFWLKIAKKAEFCYFLGMATTPNKKGTKNMDINKIKTELERELLKLDTTKSVSWEYPDYFMIETSWGDYALGNVNGPIGWNDFDGYTEGETMETEPKAIAKAFREWLITTNEGVSE